MDTIQTITIIIIVITCIVSIMGFSNSNIINKLIFYPPAISEQKEWYRFFSCGLIHADFGHLIFNMLCLYSFGASGASVETTFCYLFGLKLGEFLYFFMYVSALLICLLPSYFKNKNNYNYRSLGASGAVSAVVFASIILFPTSEIGIIFLPFIKAPAIIFGAIYLIISALLSRRSVGGINHSAHIYGGLYGVVFLIITCYTLSTYQLFDAFVAQIHGYFSHAQ